MLLYMLSRGRLYFRARVSAAIKSGPPGNGSPMLHKEKKYAV